MTRKERIKKELKELEYKLDFAIRKQHTQDIVQLCIKRNQLEKELKN